LLPMETSIGCATLALAESDPRNRSLNKSRFSRRQGCA
jgi:hypothetical protein